MKGFHKHLKEERKRHLGKHCKRSITFPHYDLTPNRAALPSHLEVEGSCQVILQGTEIENFPALKELDERGWNSVVIGAWLHGRGEMAVAHCCKRTNFFSVKVPIDEHSTEVLKIGSYMIMKDSESNLTKPFPLQTVGVHLSDLVKHEMTERCTDIFNGGLRTVLNLRCVNKESIDVGSFCRSALRDVEHVNGALTGMTEKVVTYLNKENMRAPKPVTAFETGLTYLPFAGLPSEGVPALVCHYGVLGAMLHHLDRQYPRALLLYFWTGCMQNSGHTEQSLRALMAKGPGNVEYIKFFGGVVSGFTQDAGIVPYERDGTPALQFDVDLSTQTMDIKLGVDTTEDVNILGYPVALSVEAVEDLSKEEKPDLCTHITDPQARFAALLKEAGRKVWRPMSCALGKDDCESSAMTAFLLAKVVASLDWNVQAAKKDTEGFVSFSEWTDEDFGLACDFFGEARDHMLQDNLQVMPVVGGAGGASANNVDMSETAVNIDDDDQVGGHCFGFVKGCEAQTGAVNVILLEGTNNVQLMHPHQIQSHVISVGADVSGGEGKTVTLDSCTFASALAKYMTEHTKFAEIPSMTRSQMTMNVGNPLFYKWCMYVGGSYNVDAYGHLLCSLEKLKDNKLAVGCSPASISHPDMKGFNVAHDLLSPADFEMFQKCANEIYPPLADKATFARIMNSWAKLPCPHTINQDLEIDRELQYLAVSCYEAPDSPLLRPLLAEAKGIFCEAANAANKQHGVVFRSREYGTGVTMTAYVPLVGGETGVLDSLRSTAAKLLSQKKSTKKEIRL